MTRAVPLAVSAIILGIIGAAMARTDGDGEKVKVVSTRNIKEKLDGKDAKATVVEVTIGPGQSGLAHRHPGPGFVYVLEGVYELGIDNEPTKMFKAGETFYEPTCCLHRVSRNPSATGQTRLLAVILHSRDTDEIAIREKGHDQAH